MRYAVTENTLRRGAISDDEVIHAIEVTGRGWVVEEGGQIVAFAIGDAATGGIWPCSSTRRHKAADTGRGCTT